MNEQIFEKIGQKLSSNLIATQNKESDFNHCESISNLFLPKNFMNLDFKNAFVFEFWVSGEKLCLPDYLSNVLQDYKQILNSGVGTIFLSIKNFTLKTSLKKDLLTNFFSEISKISHCHFVKVFLKVELAYGRADQNNLLFNKLKISPSRCKDNKNSKSINAHPSDIFLNKIILKLTKIFNLGLDCEFDGITLDLSSGIAFELSSFEFNNLTFGKFSEPQDFCLKLLEKLNVLTRKIPTICSVNLSSMIKELFSNDYLQIKTIKKIRTLNSTSFVFNFLNLLVSNGVDGFILNLGTEETRFLQSFLPFLDENLYVDLYKSVFDYFVNLNLRNKFKMFPILFYNENNSNANYLNQRESNEMPFVVTTKKILADNSYLLKIRNSAKYLPCIKCFYCEKQFNNDGYFKCFLNLLTQKEINYNISPKSNICVIGGGISGLVCSIILARRGYTVELFEKNSELNLNGKKCEIFELDKNFCAFNKYLLEQISDYIKSGKINVRLGETFHASNNIDLYSDIVIATGFLERNFSVSGAVLKQVISIYDALSSKANFLGVNKVTIFAKSELALKLAVYLLSKKISVSIILEKFNVFDQLNDDKFSYYMQVFNKNKAEIYPFSKLNKINEDCCEIIFNHRFIDKNHVPLLYNLRSGNKFSYIPQIKTIFHDLFIFEPDIVPNNRLLFDVVSRNYDGNVFMIGNALKIDDLSEDVKSAFYVATNI